MTLTEWWELLTTSLDNLHQRFPSANFSHSSLFHAASQIARHGVKLERYDDSIKGLLSTRKASNATLQEEEKLGKKVQGINGTSNHIPDIIFPIDALIAIAYYEHLVRYDDVISTRAILNDGTWFNPGIQARKALTSQHASILKDDIVYFLEDDKNVRALLEIHSAFGQLLTLSEPKEKFRVFSDLALGRASLIHLSGKAVEEKLGDRLSNKAQLLARILKMGKHLYEFAQTHHTWFTRKLHFIFTWFREQDSYFLKTFFVPDSWKFIYEAQKLENELVQLEEKLRVDSLVDANGIEVEFRAKLMDTKDNVLSIHRESLFFWDDAKHAKDELEEKIEALMVTSP